MEFIKAQAIAKLYGFKADACSVDGYTKDDGPMKENIHRVCVS